MSEDLRVRFLIVDDEQSIRRLCMTVGSGMGFVCLEADSGESSKDDCVACRRELVTRRSDPAPEEVGT